MKDIVIYDTSTGNTKKIAETITEALQESKIEVDLFNIKDTKKLTAKNYDFLALGTPDQIWHNEF